MKDKIENNQTDAKNSFIFYFLKFLPNSQQN